ncbi:hypothetical protein [Oscillatoria salina]|uniref:hypothetical protein n=1 Tax=Oscillatoria salina TaxID=331517 RepID=UPI001CCC2D12|nr:hypothetical protein [Oscillatoria salina]MBZ8179215.1 hypothetical protein [Oscillatoria salina IIICB1]
MDKRKIDYLFNQNIASDAHNTPRAASNFQQIQRLGFWNTSEDREIIIDHLQQVMQTPNNITQEFTKTFRDRTGIVKEAKIEVRESLLAGRSGKFAKVKSSWEIMTDGTRRFVSAEFYGS